MENTTLLFAVSEGDKDAVLGALDSFGVDTVTAEKRSAIINQIQTRQVDIAIIDITLPEFYDRELVRDMKEFSPETDIVLVTDFVSSDILEDEVLDLVYEYVIRLPDYQKKLTQTIHRELELRQLKAQNKKLLSIKNTEPETMVHNSPNVIRRRKATSKIPALVGESKAVNDVREQILEIAETNLNVLIRGESGTGKDVVSRLLHGSSNGKNSQAFVKINCPSIPETLLESELFGHEAGSFTGAAKRKPGRFEFANNGTIFLDEIGEIPVTLQAKLLQFIESKQFNRVGGIETIYVDARLVSATNAPLEKMIKEKTFREDLFYRLNEYPITLPPLRSRKEDIPVLIEYFCKTLSEENERERLKISDGTLSHMMEYQWPGNVRELQAVIKRFVFSGNEQTILNSIHVEEQREERKETLAEKMEDTEKNKIYTTLIQARWNQRKTADMLGMSYSQLRRRIEKYGLNNAQYKVS